MGIKREGTIFLQSLLFRSSRRTALANLWWCSPQRVGVFWFLFFCNFQQDIEPNTQGKSQGPP